MSERVDELLKAIRTLTEEERADLIARMWVDPRERPIMPMETLRRLYDGLWVVLELPEGEDEQNPQRARFIASGPTDEEAINAAEAIGFEGVMDLFYFGQFRGLDVPLVPVNDDYSADLTK